MSIRSAQISDAGYLDDTIPARPVPRVPCLQMLSDITSFYDFFIDAGGTIFYVALLL